MVSEGLKIQDRLFKKTILRIIPKWVLPNHITILRFLLTPLVMWLTITQQYGIAVVVFLLVAFTDILDGSLARVRNQVTKWGKLYDPVADKVLIGSLVAIVVTQHLGVYLGAAIIIIELIFIGLGFWWTQNGHAVQANKWGKIKMFLQVCGVTILLVGLATGFQGLFGISATTFYLAIFFAIISLFSSGV